MRSFILVGFISLVLIMFIFGKCRAPGIMQKFTPRLDYVTRTPKIPKRTCNCFWHKGSVNVCLWVA